MFNEGNSINLLQFWSLIQIISYLVIILYYRVVRLPANNELIRMWDKVKYRWRQWGKSRRNLSYSVSGPISESWTCKNATHSTVMYVSHCKWDWILNKVTKWEKGHFSTFRVMLVTQEIFPPECAVFRSLGRKLCSPCLRHSCPALTGRRAGKLSVSCDCSIVMALTADHRDDQPLPAPAL
jgi:hypothetical protein